ncbi:GNAT family N-acetyltransferase [Paenibacillus sacheonensis]|uniref:GNAT family N-acetyltransferase n=1 Tax=Paenibacillus sacheonensis TaxID=742054 RepID=A0A7X5C4N2_9BACL|nr:GNAT family N-acetyltransferase [Paenibacillus sacheonensis]MBM7568856.1 putative acetyltransferase [Paenibacillus sacheonensis]NBC72559.1 GNAT family N-acetyltransferase [Paenibacillus sacheonensis]
MNELRTLHRDELADSFALSEFAFQYELKEEDRNEQIGRTDENQVWGYFADGKLAAKLQLIPLHIWVNGRRFAMGGIGGVATWPEYRRGGMVARLLGQSLKTMRDRGQTVSLLSPFKFEFYRKYGWEAFVDQLHYEIPVDKLPKFEAAEGSTVRRAAKDGKLLNAIYAEYAKQFNGMIDRDEAWWTTNTLRKKGTAAIYANPQGEPRGYVYYHVSNRVATLHELVFLDEEARRGLWKFIADHDSMIAKVEVKAPVDDQLPFLTQDPRFKQERVPYFSARIVDVEAFLKQYAFAVDAEAEPIQLQVTDKHADWNQGTYRLEFTASGEPAAVTKLGEGEVQEDGMLSCTIQTLAALLMGYQRAGFMARIGRLQGSQEQVNRLEAAIPQRTPYLTDFF